MWYRRRPNLWWVQSYQAGKLHCLQMRKLVTTAPSQNFLLDSMSALPNLHFLFHWISPNGIMYSQFGVGPLLYLCCSFHVPPLYIFCPPVVPLMCSCSPSLVPLVPFLLFLSSSTLPLPFTWWHWEDLKRPYRVTLLSLFCSFEPYKITCFERNNHPISEFFSREGLWFKTP